jgi:hypothetical protein
MYGLQTRSQSTEGEINILSLKETEPRFLGYPFRHVVTIPTELPRLPYMILADDMLKLVMHVTLKCFATDRNLKIA